VKIEDLPLQLWAFQDGSDMVGHRNLAPVERARAAAKIDYLVIAGWAYYRAAPTEIETALRRNPAFADLGKDARVELLMAPLDALRPDLALETLQPDLLDLSLTHWALALPLAPMNEQAADNTPLAPEAVASALCPTQGDASDLYCLNLLNR
jgi:hypothetical protein